ncbi:PDZ domain-containing protein [Stenotrophomonas cyclobalanopsidis]|uniref:PDZ domain-containing protein n=1 Tax=Stenotrophomonas cyclobalanopsidis TaxID=2771362 RepID=UPI00345F8309
MLATTLPLLLALAGVPAQAAAGGDTEPLTEAALGPDYVGYQLFDPGLVEFRRLPSAGDYGTYLIYRTAREALENYDACLQADPDNREQVEAAYQQLVGGQQRYVSAAQWRELQRALRARRTQVPERAPWQCAAFVGNAPYFDAGLDDALLGAAELARERAGEGDMRSDALRPVLGVQMGGPALIESEPGPGPARRAGLRKGDEVLAVAGTRVKTVFGVGQALKAHAPGDRVEVRVRRTEWNGSQPQVRELTVVVVLESRAAVLVQEKGQ